MSPEAKSNLTAWLGTINDHALWLTNWEFFGVLVNVALLKVGSDRFNQQALDKCLSNINSLYVGDGWYTDAYPYSQFDYYNAFAFHFYGLLYATFMQERDPVQSQQFKERANIFGQQFVYWFDKTGAAVPYGRSLTYRSKYGFSVRKENVSLALMAPDSDLVFKVGDIFVGRKAPSKVQISNGTITTQWSPFPGIDVTTVITPTLHGHSRRHTIVSWQNCVAYDCGFSHPLEYKNYAAETDNVTAQVRSDLGSCTVYLHDPDGNMEQTEGVIIQAAPNTNLLFPRTSIPAVKFSVREGITNVLTSIITD